LKEKEKKLTIVEREESDRRKKRRYRNQRRCCVGMGCVELSQSNTPTKGKRFLLIKIFLQRIQNNSFF
jgi:hypothetical protein